jgi:hypothetical protein
MPDPTGRWLNRTQWQCPRCAWVNSSRDETCQQCGASVRPSADEPPRPPDPLDIIGYDESRAGDAGPVQLAAKAIHALTKVTREKATALFVESLHTGLKGHGEQGQRAWQTITEMPESDLRAAVDSMVDDLEQGGFALYRIRDDERG